MLSGIGFAFFTRRLARADNTNRFFAILQPPLRIDDNEHSSSDREAKAFETALVTRVRRIIPIKSFGITEYGRGFLERDAVLPQIREGFSGVPGEHLLYIQKCARGIKGKAESGKAQVQRTCSRRHGKGVLES